MVAFYMIITIVLGACAGAVGYQQYLIHHPAAAQEVCNISK